MSDNEESYEAEFELDDPSPPRLENEHCKAKRSQIDDIGRSRCEQVRIEFDIENEGAKITVLLLLHLQYVQNFHHQSWPIIYHRQKETQ